MTQDLDIARIAALVGAPARAAITSPAPPAWRSTGAAWSWVRCGTTSTAAR
ncbi:hypothetical protein [Thiomonas sp.]